MPDRWYRVSLDFLREEKGKRSDLLYETLAILRSSVYSWRGIEAGVLRVRRMEREPAYEIQAVYRLPIFDPGNSGLKIVDFTEEFRPPCLYCTLPLLCTKPPKKTWLPFDYMCESCFAKVASKASASGLPVITNVTKEQVETAKAVWGVGPMDEMESMLGDAVASSSEVGSSAVRSLEGTPERRTLR